MNTILLFLIAVPAIEIYLMIKIGQNIGAFTTVSLIFITAILGIYFARLEGMNTLRSGIYNLYKNKVPLFEMMSGATIAVRTSTYHPRVYDRFFWFRIIVTFYKKINNQFFLKNKRSVKDKNNNYIEGEIIEKDSEKKDEL